MSILARRRRAPLFVLAVLFVLAPASASPVAAGEPSAAGRGEIEPTLPLGPTAWSEPELRALHRLAGDSVFAPVDRAAGRAEIERENELFLRLLEGGEEPPRLEALPDAAGVLELAERFRATGALALEVAEPGSEATGGGEVAYCGTPEAILLRSLARQADLDGELELVERVDEMLTGGLAGAEPIEAMLGPEWSLPLPETVSVPVEPVLVEPGPADLEDPGAAEPGAGRAELSLPPGYGVHRSALFAELTRSRSVFKPICDSVPGADRQLTFPVPGFTLHYKICGPSPIQQHQLENTSFVHQLPGGLTAPIRSCTSYSATCAPTVIQIIAAELGVVSRTLSVAGFPVPLGLGGTASVPVYVTGEAKSNTSYLGQIWYHLGIGLPATTTLRQVVYHEYFHLIQETFGSVHVLVWDSGLWRGPRPDYRPDAFYWQLLEGTADWAANVVASRFPRYVSGLGYSDARSTPFGSSYHPLPYGYLTERFTASRVPRFCYGCDVMLTFLRTYVQPEAWGPKALTSFLSDRGLSYPDFLDQYFWDLLSSRYHTQPAPAAARFVNRHPDNLGKIEPWDWPPGLMDAAVKDGGCTPHGVIEPAKGATGAFASRRLRVTCRTFLAASGAVYFRLPLDEKRVPSSITISAAAKLWTPPGEQPLMPQVLTDMRPQVTTVLGARFSGGEKDYRRLVAKDVRQGVSPLRLTTFEPVRNDAGIDELHVMVRNPNFLWAYGPRGLMELTLTVDAGWDDVDQDGFAGADDNCPAVWNPLQDDGDGDGAGDRCDDSDGDGSVDHWDNCPGVANPLQDDPDGDWVGTACDNCPQVSNWQQTDSDGDGEGDACAIDLTATRVAKDGRGFLVTLENLGGGTIRRWWTYSIQFSGWAWADLGSGQTARRKVELEAPLYRLVPSARWPDLELAPGSEHTFRIGRRFLDPGGHHFLMVTVDSTDAIEESDERNNSAVMVP